MTCNRTVRTIRQGKWVQYGKESAEFLASVALASRLNAHCTECHIVARLHVYMSEPRSVFFLVLTWHMNCSVSRLRRGTMLVLLVVPPPASSHITDSRSITRALQRTWELYFCRTRNIRWIFELKMQNTFLKCLPSHLHSSCVYTLKPLHRAVAEPRVSTKEELSRQVWTKVYIRTKIQKHKSTNTQIHKFTNTQIHT